jgi:hypothetical protein
MQITIHVPDEHINNALRAPHSRYWASAASWDPATKQGHVVDTRDNGSIHELDAEDLARALIRMVALKPLQVVALAGGVYDGITGDTLLQLMAFNELRYG